MIFKDTFCTADQHRISRQYGKELKVSESTNGLDQGPVWVVNTVTEKVKMYLSGIPVGG